MTKIKTADASGAVLDWLVAKCEGADVGIISPGWVVKASCSVFGTRRLLCPLEEGGEFYSPSTIWEQGGPIIEREGMTVGRQIDPTQWAAEVFDASGTTTFVGYGPTPLTAAMRCFVASCAGDEVEVPEEFLKD